MTYFSEFLMKEIPGERLFVIAPKVIADTVASAQNRRVEFLIAANDKMKADAKKEADKK